MPVFRLPRELLFPAPELSEPSGLLAIGGDLSPERLLKAYALGIFPWYSEGEPILWWSPDPRMVLRADELHVPKSLAKRMRRGDLVLTMDQAFARVVAHCAAVPRPGQPGTWITPEMRRAYERLHERGYAHSVEVWRGEDLVGGLYGVSIGGLFAGESMFALEADASKIAWVSLVRQLARWGIDLLDCQVYTDHLARFGAYEVARTRYLADLRQALALPDRVGPWRFDPPACT